MIQVKSTYNREDAMKQGAFYTGTYPNFLAEIGLSAEEIAAVQANLGQ